MKPVRLLAAAVLAAALGATAWAALAPVRFDSREAVFEIPEGTWARRMAGDDVEILPAQVRLTVGLQDVLVLRNRDEVPQTFGPTVLMPGQSFSLPFEVASTYSFACTAHASGQMTVVVEPRPDSPWQRLRWRWRAWMGAA
jgi:plastocyanin